MNVFPVPKGWSGGWCGYLMLSAAYDAEFQEAGSRGWSRTAIDGTRVTNHHHRGIQTLRSGDGCVDEPLPRWRLGLGNLGEIRYHRIRTLFGNPLCKRSPQGWTNERAVNEKKQKRPRWWCTAGKCS